MSRRGRKRKMDVEDKVVFDWDKDKVLSDNFIEKMESMWELPQIYHFLQLTKEALCITHLSMYEVERMLLMPKASKQLAHIMTCLLSSPSINKVKLQKLPPMPYEFWTNILAYKLRSWFKLYDTKHQDVVKVFDSVGVEPEFWKVFPNFSDIEGKDFDDFTFKQKVWTLKTVCDTVMHSRKSIQEELSKQPSESQFETILGVDRYGARYIYFPQFLHNDLRIYRHCLDNKVLSTVKPPPSPRVIPKQEPVTININNIKVCGTKRKRRRRKSSWRNGSLPPKQKKNKNKFKNRYFIQKKQTCNVNNRIDLLINEESCDSSSRSSSKFSEQSLNCNISEVTSICDATEDSDLTSTTSFVDNENDKTPCSTLVTKDMLVNNTQIKDNCSKDFSATEDLTNSSKTDDEKIEEFISKNGLKNHKKNEECEAISPSNDVNISQSDDEKLSNKQSATSESKMCLHNCESGFNDCLDIKNKSEDLVESSRNSDDDEVNSNSTNSGSRRSARIQQISGIKLEVEEAENILHVRETEELSSIDLRDSLCREGTISESVVNGNSDEKDFFDYENCWKVEDFNELINDLGVSNFKLVADSVETFQELIESIKSDNTNRDFTNEDDEFIRPACEDKLLQRMSVLLESLENVDTLLKDSAKRAKAKLQKEWYNFENSIKEDQESSNEDGLASNWWVIGSQGCPLPSITGDASLQTLSHITLPSFSSNQEDLNSSKVKIENCESPEKESNRETEAGSEGKITENEGENKVKEEKSENQENKGETEDKKISVAEERPTRVLRTRGVSSYTEQLFSSEDSEEEKLGRWADIEAIYATPGSQTDTSTFNVNNAKSRDSTYESDEEDSDQEWILPGTRKRRNRRSSSGRRLKSLQYKIQNIKSDVQIDNVSKIQQQSEDTKAIPIHKDPLDPSVSNAQISSLPDSNVISSADSNVISSADSNVISSSESVPPAPICRIESVNSLQTVLDIKKEEPSLMCNISVPNQNPNIIQQPQQNYVVVTTGQVPASNYYVMSQNPTQIGTMVQQGSFVQPTAAFPSVQAVPYSGYVQNTPNYIVQNPTGLVAQQTFIASQNCVNTPILYQQPQGTVVQQQPYMQYIAQPSQPRIISSTALSPARQLNFRARAPVQNIRMPLRPNLPNSNGAVIRSSPIANIQRPRQPGYNRGTYVQRRSGSQVSMRQQTPRNVNANTTAKTTSLIVLSDSDDEIEMIVPAQSEKTNKNSIKRIAPKVQPRRQPSQQLQQNLQQQIKPKIPNLNPQLLQRMNEGGVSISPIKPANPPPQPQTVASSTQLVVVVNETGSHYAIALPNGSKIILTPEQVAQIRASNDGKLIL